MKQNLLCLKPELGKPLKRCYQLPKDTFIYGKPYFAIDGGVAAAMIHPEIDHYKGKAKLKPKDFVKLNAAAVMSGLITAKVSMHFIYFVLFSRG